MAHTLEDISRATGLDCVGNPSLVVERPAEPSAAGAGDLALAMSEKFADELAGTAARAAVLWDGADWQALGFDGALIARRPRVALALITHHFQHPLDIEPGVHHTAYVDPSARLGQDVSVGPFALVGKNAQIGDGARIASHVSIGADTRLGDRALLHSGVRLGARCHIGADFIAQPNAVIGADGFSFEPPQRGAVESARETGTLESAVRTDRFLRIHSLASVEIGDDVEIGAATTIDRGTIAPTRIGTGTKIDNQVQIGHNVEVGAVCLICAQVGIAGSTTIGDRVVLGGRVGIADHRKIGSDVICAAGTLVPGNLPDGAIVMGAPALPREQAARQFAAMRRLPKLLETVAEIQKKLGL
ncbi:MAG: UDP-3-O-(3-hydroxymyristoyl)glucosamine N-acyltransferase [Pseudomonadota bacterium]